MNLSYNLILAATLGTVSALAQVPFDGAPVTLDFDSTRPGVLEGAYDGSGLQSLPATGQLDSNAWAVDGLSDGALGFGESGTSGDYARGTSDGGTSTGGLYAFRVGGTGDVGLGFQPINGDLTPGSITLRIQNITGSQLETLTVSYEVHVWNDQDRANSLNFSYSTDGISFTPVAALDYTSPEAADATPVWTLADRQTTLFNLAIANGAQLELRWSTDDVSGSGSRDEFALDDIHLAAPVPEPAHAALAVAVLLGGWTGVRRRLGQSGGRSGQVF
ncbi:MAG: hypothetical protein H7A46_16840 [Verrucomicrobiales bacterium]|nr:hypothetical protein [Verrucomicrobiales bacterium]